jgi:hypothetical protein
MRQARIPKSFGVVRETSHHVAERSWAGLTSFMTAQSVLVLAWATMLGVRDIPSRAIVLIWIAGIGAATSLLWALLSTRMWHYHISYEERVRGLVLSHSRGKPDRDLTILRDVNQAVRKDWELQKAEGESLIRRLARQSLMSPIVLSGNHWVLFLAPMLFSVLHMVMMYVAWCCEISVPASWSIRPHACLAWGICGPDGFGIAAAIYGALLLIVGIHCVPIILRKPRQ